ncbi:hypothetical protein ACFE04_017498 [Oxalis oulophora]
MAKSLLIFSLLLLFISISLSTQNPNPTTTTTTTTAHTELTQYGFPIGLLPSSIKSYAINSTTGEFYVDIGSACKVTLPPDNYLATYSPKVKGKIVKGKIAELDGIKVRAFYQWWAITGIRSSGDDLVFEVGVVSAKMRSFAARIRMSCLSSVADIEKY